MFLLFLIICVIRRSNASPGYYTYSSEILQATPTPHSSDYTVNENDYITASNKHLQTLEQQYHITQIKPTKGSTQTSIKRMTISQNVLSTISTHGEIYEKREFISTLIVIYILLIFKLYKKY